MRAARRRLKFRLHRRIFAGVRSFSRRRHPLAFLLVLCAVCALASETLRHLRSDALSPSAPIALRAIALSPSILKFKSDDPMTPDMISELVTTSPFEPVTSRSGPVPEPPLPEGVDAPLEPQKYGHGASSFLVDSRWATIRFLGPAPAGLGLSGEALNKAQIAALGAPNDSIPVITAAATINNMMKDYFAPLLASLPGGNETLKRIKVQGAYFSPQYTPELGQALEYNNAYIYGLQTLLIYPSSCHKEGMPASTCPRPFFSTGHDPTVMGHELGHVVFNHLRGKKSLEGFQWFAVNEGYADYFSASYFSEPMLGRIWHVKQQGFGHLRRLVGDVTTESPAYLREGHLFGVVFSSSLWRARARLASELKATPRDIDRVVLQSIVFLGETEKPRLGDAATAVLKAAEVLGRPDFKAIYKDEFERAKISLEQAPELGLTPRGDDIAYGQTSSAEPIQCGVVATRSARARPVGSAGFVLAAPLLLPFLSWLMLRTVRRLSLRLRLATVPGHARGRLLASLTTALAPWIQGCNLFTPKEAVEAQPPGPSLIYTCKPEEYDASASPSRSTHYLTLTWLENDAAAKPAEQSLQRVLVSDLRFDRTASALILVLDAKTRHVDQVRDRAGNVFELDMKSPTVTFETALAYQNMRLASLILQNAAMATRDALEQKSKEAKATFYVDGRLFSAVLASPLFGAGRYGPLPRQVGVGGKTVCAFKEERR